MKALVKSALVVAALGLMAGGCNNKKKTDFNYELEPGRMALEKIPLAEWPEFSFEQTKAAELSKAAGYSVEYLEKRSSAAYFPYLDISHDRALASCVAFKTLLDQQAQSPMGTAALNAKLRDEFECYRSIGGWDPEKEDFSRTVLFTGYFTPIYDASLTPTAEYKYPLYKRPADLMTDPEGITASRKTPDGQFVLYYTREEIEKGNLLSGNELVYLKSRWQAYVISIQGSARLRLPDGRIYEVGYAGNNGFPYDSPGKKLLAEGKITKEELSLKGLQTYFDSHPEMMDQYLSINRRFVFFKERPGGPFGKLNTPVTAFGTVATDKSVYPRGMPSFVMTTIPTQSGGTSMYNSWLMDQDAGGAIRASGRADIYMGIGPEAEAISGRQLNEGKFYYIAVKPELVEKYLAMAPARPAKRGGGAE